MKSVFAIDYYTIIWFNGILPVQIVIVPTKECLFPYFNALFVAVYIL